MKLTWSLLLHGESGEGKSWLADTAPPPRLVIDLEGRAKYTPSGPKVLWDPRYPPPVYDGSWQTCVVNCHDFNTLQLVYQWLRSGQHPFVSVVIDSLMEAQKRCIDQIVGMEALQTQDWGTLLRKLEQLVRSYRDLTMIEANSVQFVILIVGTSINDKTGTAEPLLQGQLRKTVPYYIDTVGYMFQNPTPEGVFVRSMLVHKTPGFIAKDGTGKLPGPVIPNPNLGTLVELLASAGKPEEIAPAAVQEGAAAV